MLRVYHKTTLKFLHNIGIIVQTETNNIVTKKIKLEKKKKLQNLDVHAVSAQNAIKIKAFLFNVF